MKPFIKKISAYLIFLAIGFFLFLLVTVVKGSWIEPNQPPPAGNIAAPITVEEPYQQKFGTGVFPGYQDNTGSLSANDFWLESKGKWLSQLGGIYGCNWTGMKCDCDSETGGLSIQFILGLNCTNNIVSQIKIIDVNVGGGTCPVANPFPSVCTTYHFSNTVDGPDILNSYLTGLPPTFPYVINLSWDDDAPNEDGFNLEYVYRPPGGSWSQWVPWATLSPNVNTYQWQVPSGASGWSYRFRVRAYLINGVYSNWIQSPIRTIP